LGQGFHQGVLVQDHLGPEVAPTRPGDVVNEQAKNGRQ
jgi:hypothetical protein